MKNIHNVDKMHQGQRTIYSKQLNIECGKHDRALWHLKQYNSFIICYHYIGYQWFYFISVFETECCKK